MARSHSINSATDAAQEVWRAGVAAVDSRLLVRQFIRCDATHLSFGDRLRVDLAAVDRLVVVGAGKAGSGMAAGLLDAIPELVAQRLALSGWINVPDDAAVDLPRIRLFPARPPAVNLPTPRVVEGTREILRQVQACGPRDVCVALISGGGSALLALPVAAVPLEDKIALTRYLSGAGADIRQLNSVRIPLSQVKGGGLVAACGGTLVALILSDVIGDPLDVIASGPTVPPSTSAEEGWRTLRQLDPSGQNTPPSIARALQSASKSQPPSARSVAKTAHNFVIGNLRTALDAAARRARELGCMPRLIAPVEREGLVESVAETEARRLRAALTAGVAHCWISGGEPTVRLADTDQRGCGGRNQQLVLAIARWLLAQGVDPTQDFCFVSAGTDGEDGPTDAAGGWLDGRVLKALASRPEELDRALRRNDAYPLLEELGALFKTGPTGTNVCDLRVGWLCGGRG